MGQRVVLASERRDLWERGLEATEGVWPEYNLHGDTPDIYWTRLDEDFPEFQFVLHDEDADEILAQGYSLPLRWDGTEAGLPAGFDGLLEDGFALREEGGEPNALSALAIEVPTAGQGRGTSRTMIQAMRALAAEHGFGAALAPLRPVWKERYPLAAIDRYTAWRRADGLPFDPWVRVHVSLGAEILRPEPRSLRISGTVADWEGWTEMAFPETGEYVFPRGLAPLTIDREADTGLYFEPNVWVVHTAARSVRFRVVTKTRITCPKCGFQKVETMPVGACQHFYRCEGCAALLRPLDGDCCVFCSYADERCPSMQTV